MNKQRKERPATSVSEMRDALGLPPDHKTPHGKGRPARDAKTQHGGLTFDGPTRRDGAPVNDNFATGE